MLDALGGRKFIFALLVVILAFVLVLTGHVEAAKWIEFVEYVGTVYVAGNILARTADKALGSR